MAKNNAEKNPAAVALGKLGAAATNRKMTPEQRIERARRAGLASLKSITPERRRENGRRGAMVRWAKWNAAMAAAKRSPEAA
jgi:hypothetical protein